MVILLSQRQAFNAMIIFLEKYYDATKSNQVNSLLSDMDMQTWGSGDETADPALWDDWIDCIHGKQNITIQEAYYALSLFVDMRYTLEPDKHIVALIHKIQNTQDNELWQLWLKAVKQLSKKLLGAGD